MRSIPPYEGYVRLSYPEMHKVFEEWNKGELESYLIEITRDILAYNDEDGTPLAEKILDTAGQKGTGKWTVFAALDEGIPLTLIGEAVFSRCLSAMKEERLHASKVLGGEIVKSGLTPEQKNQAVENIRQALLASKIVSYTQGYMLMKTAAKTYGWNLNYGGIALMWRGGCIIRSVFLGKIKEAYDKNPGLENLLLDDYFTDKIKSLVPGWRNGGFGGERHSVPALSAALSWFDGYRCELPANLLEPKGTISAPIL